MEQTRLKVIDLTLTGHLPGCERSPEGGVCIEPEGPDPDVAAHQIYSESQHTGGKLDSLAADMLTKVNIAGDVYGDLTTGLYCCSRDEPASNSELSYALGLEDIVAIEPDILQQILSYCSNEDVVHVSQANMHMKMKCEYELKRRRKHWYSSLLQARPCGQCRVFNFEVDFPAIRSLGHLLDQQRDCTEVLQPIAMSVMERILAQRLRNKVRRGDIVNIIETESCSKLSVVAVQSSDNAGNSSHDRCHPISFNRIIWQSLRGEAFLVFPKGAHSLVKDHGYRKYFRPFLQCHLKRPCYAVLPSDCSLSQSWKAPGIDKTQNNRQLMFLNMFPPHKLSLILELCACEKGRTDSSHQPPSLISYRRFYTINDLCSGEHKTLWWV